MLQHTEATISCVVTGLTKKLDAVTWEKLSSGAAITHNTDSYQIDVGTYDTETNSQTTILTIPAGANTADAVYACFIQSDEHGKLKTSASQKSTDVNSNVFSE